MRHRGDASVEGAGEVSSARSSRVSDDTLVFSVDELWLGGRAQPAVLEADADGIRVAPDGVSAQGRLPGTALPGFRDVHVHLGLVDPSTLLANGIATVIDCGWIPEVAASWVGDAALPEVRICGAFLTCPGGYPSDRSWAPAGSVREVTAQDAASAVDEQLAHGAEFIKVTLNSAAGPVLDDATLRAIVARAHARGARVIAHTEGEGQAARAFAAEVDELAHAPFTERLGDDLLRAMAHTLVWASTLDIHGHGEHTPELDTALDNVRRFHAYGGVVRYGSDLGNGNLPVGINPRELALLAEADLSPTAMINAVAAPSAGTDLGRRISVADDATGAPHEWLARTRVLDHHQIRELLQ